MGPELAVADGALASGRGSRRYGRGRAAARAVGCPKSQQSKAKRARQEIWMTETKKYALAAFDALIETWGVKYDKAVGCRVPDQGSRRVACLRLPG